MRAGLAWCWDSSSVEKLDHSLNAWDSFQQGVGQMIVSEEENDIGTSSMPGSMINPMIGGILGRFWEEYSQSECSRIQTSSACLLSSYPSLVCIARYRITQLSVVGLGHLRLLSPIQHIHVSLYIDFISTSYIFIYLYIYIFMMTWWGVISPAGRTQGGVDE